MKDKYTIRYNYTKGRTYNLYLEGKLSHENKTFIVESAKLLPGLDVTNECEMGNSTQLYFCVTGHKFAEWGTGSNGIEDICPMIEKAIDYHFIEQEEIQNKIKESERIIKKRQDEYNMRGMNWFQRFIYKVTN